MWRLIIPALLWWLASTVAPGLVTADTNPASALVISQVKITSSNGQFLVLYNTTDTTLDMTKYQLNYFNNYDLSKATSSKLVALSGSLPAHSYYMISDDNSLICYQLTVDAVALGFSSSAGLVQVLAVSQTGPGSSVSSLLQDYVGWSKSVAAGAQTLPSVSTASLLRQPVDAQNNPSVSTPGSGSWLAVQPDSANTCNLVTVANPQTTTDSGSQLLTATPPPAIILPVVVDAAPLANAGLAAPQLTELLPNPIGSGNDATDEFIEIYNPNPVTFDLSSYSLQVGTTSLHGFVFPKGSSLSPQSFTAFYASQTGLSLSNAGGQAQLVDLTSQAISLSAVYDTAKDGQAWALANGSWSWTVSPTPGSLNVISQLAATPASVPPNTTSKTINNQSTLAATAALPATTVKAVTNSSDLTPIHAWTLALVAGLALLYGAYEYRTDLGNRLHQLREHLRHRRTDRSTTAWWRGHRTGQ